MALVPKTDVDIDGETYDLVSIPNPKSTTLAKKAKEALLGSLDLASLMDDLGKLGHFIRVAYNSVAGNTEIQIKVQRVGYKITNLADQSAITVNNFKRASQNVLQELQGTYQFLLDGLEEMALETLPLLTDVAAEMATAAEKLHDEFEKEEKAIDAQYSFLGNLADAFTGALGAAKAIAQKDVVRAIESLQKIGDNIGHIEVMKMANEEKIKHLDEMREKQREIRREALLQCIEFTEKIKSCKDDDALADAAIEALHNSIGALKSLSAIMMNAALFWRQMQSHCESLAKGDMHQLVEKAMKYPVEKRLKVWLSRAFKVKAVLYYSKWVALDDVCEVYMLQIKDTRQDLYSYLTENPTIEEAKKNVRELAATFAADLEKAQEKLAEKLKEALEEKKSLEDFK